MQSAVPADLFSEDDDFTSEREPLPIDRRLWTHGTGEIDLSTGIVRNFE
jgi:hypothetical protein